MNITKPQKNALSFIKSQGGKISVAANPHRNSNNYYQPGYAINGYMKYFDLRTIEKLERLGFLKKTKKDITGITWEITKK